MEHYRNVPIEGKPEPTDQSALDGSLKAQTEAQAMIQRFGLTAYLQWCLLNEAADSLWSSDH